MLARGVRFVSGPAARGLATASDSKKFTFGRKFETYKCDSPDNFLVVTKTELNELWDQMTGMRRLEIEADNLYKTKLIRGFCHLYIGQEAIAAGMEAGSTKDDAIITAYRAHCQMIGRGASYEETIAELMGKETGCSLGKGGSMHMYTKNFYGGNGIVGAQVPLGAGIALSLKLQGKKDAVCYSMYGDGAANQGQVFEAFNMAKLLNLPVIFVCENNHYGMGTAEHRAAANTKFFTRGDYIPGIKVDGMDVLAVKTACSYARKWVAAGKGPMILEMNTYRYRGHSMTDPGVAYRKATEVDEVRSTLDCIELARNRLLESKWATEEELKDREKKIRAEITAAVAKATGAKELPADHLFDHIYATATYHTVRNVEHKDSAFK